MSDDQQPAVAGTENEADPVDAAGLPRRRLLQALGGAAGVASAGLPRGPVGRGRAQSDGNDGDWSQQQKLAPDDGDDRDQFGFAASVSADGTTAVVGASRGETPNGENAGSAYVFTRNDGQWSLQQKLVPADGGDNEFGRAVSVSGDGTTALIGARGDADPNGEGAGSAYVFTRNDGEWSLQRKLVPDDGDDDDLFGNTVSVSEDGAIAVIGAPGDEDPNGEGAGSAYVFSRSNGQWTQQPKLAPDDGDDTDFFGGAVSVSGDGSTALIGAPGDADPNGEGAGSAYAFTTQSPDAMPTRTATPSPSPTQSTGTATPTTATTGSDPGTASTTTTETATTANGPGFGGLTAAAAVGIVGYLLRRRRHSGSDD